MEEEVTPDVGAHVRADVRAAVLWISDDEALGRWVQGHAAGHGVEVLTADPGEATAGTVSARTARIWGQAPLVLIGVDALPALAAHRLPPHPQIHVVLPRHRADTGTLTAAVALGVRGVISDDAGDRLGTLLAAVADPRPPGRVLGFLGARGGEGVSVLATSVALAAAAGGAVALLQPDPWGPAPAHVLGARAPSSGTLTWGDVAPVGGILTPVALRDGLPEHRGVAVLAHPRPGAPPVPTEVLRGVVEGARNAFDVVIVDLHLHEHAQSADTLAVSDRAWLLTRPRALGLTAARAALTHGVMPPARTRVMLRGTGVSTAVAARTLGNAVTHRMAEDRRLDEALDLGAGPIGGRRTPLTRAAAAVLGDLATSADLAATRLGKR